MDALQPYRVAIEPAWIDYNGHLRDAYYAVAFSLAVDDVMDQLGLDADYRARTRGTLYTLEMHLHFLHEIKQADALALRSYVLDCDRKRILLAGVFERGATGAPAAVAEAMLLHVIQNDEPASAPFSAATEELLQHLQRAAAASWPADLPRSRTLAIRRS
ncbi:MAG TPA: thioesterase family protein [Steroidobacteraceae bacterium]|nr:thioesterase family protein [Steroidobacteraceae bacterium]